MKIHLLGFSLVALSLFSCSKEELSQDSVVDTNMGEQHSTPLDQWIMENYTLPYGMEVAYRWNKHVNQHGTYAYPPSIDKVQPILETLKELWIDVYTSAEIGGEHFFLGKNPLKIYLYGGAALDVNGVEMLGNREASSLELSIYHVDSFDRKDPNKLFVLMRSVHHQFAKRLADVYPYDRNDFLKFSDGHYMRTTDFLNRTSLPKTGKEFLKLRDYSMKNGFCTLQSMVLPEDDFAEMTSVMLLYNPTEIERQFTHETVKKKKEFVENYYAQQVKIPFRKLQVACIKKMNAFQHKQKENETKQKR